MPEPFKLVFQEAIKVVNFIKSRALQSRLFTKLCSEMGSDHIQLLLHTEVRWLSRGRMLSRLFELHYEVQLFLEEKALCVTYVHCPLMAIHYNLYCYVYYNYNHFHYVSNYYL